MEFPCFLSPRFHDLLLSLSFAKEKLKVAIEKPSPGLEELQNGIKKVKIALRRVDNESRKYFAEDRLKDEKDRNLNFVWEKMSEAEDILYPSDYSLDKILFVILKENNDKRVETKEDYKDTVEIINEEFDEKPLDDIKEVEDLQCDESGDKSEIEESTENVANQRELSGKVASVTSKDEEKPSVVDEETTGENEETKEAEENLSAAKSDDKEHPAHDVGRPFQINPKEDTSADRNDCISNEEAGAESLDVDEKREEKSNDYNNLSQFLDTVTRYPPTPTVLCPSLMAVSFLSSLDLLVRCSWWLRPTPGTPSRSAMFLCCLLETLMTCLVWDPGGLSI